MSRSVTILRNIASNWIGFAVNAGVTLVLTPYVLHHLGVARYGIWMLTASIIGYYGLLDLGFRAGVAQYLIRFIAARDFGRATQCISTAVVALSGLGVLFVALSVAAALFAPRIFDFPPEVRHEAFWCILIVGCSASFQFAMSPFPAVFAAVQRFDLANMIGISTRLLMAALVALALKLDFGLIGLSAATCGVSLLDYLVRWRVACRLVPRLSVSWRHARRERLREIGAFGAWNFLISINTYVYTHVPNILIGWFLPIAAVGHYALSMGLSRQVNSVLSPVGQVMYPAAAELHVQEDFSGLRRLYHDGSRLMLLAAIPLVLMASFWAEDFYRLWIGESYVSGSTFPSVAFIFRILLLGVGVSYASSIGQQILISAGRIRPVALALVSGSLLNVALSVTLIHPLGLAGVACSVVTGAVAVDLIAMPLMLKNLLGLGVIDFVRHACVRPVAAGVLQAALMAGIRYGGGAATWTAFILQGALAVLGSACIALLVVVLKEERQRLLVLPLRRLWNRRRAAGSETELTVRERP